MDPRFIRPAEVDLLVGDATKAGSTPEWELCVSFEEPVVMMMETDLRRLQTKELFP